MGKTLLRPQLRSKTPLHALRCKRFCSCCGEVNFKPRQKSRKRSLKKKDIRKHQLGPRKLFNTNRAFLQVNPFEKKVIPGCKDTNDVKVLLKQLTVNITRLSNDVLKVLLEYGSISAYNVVTEVDLSRSCTLENPSVTPARRLRSTPVHPVVRHDILDKLRELNADWRSTSYPFVFGNSTDNDDLPELCMKTLFLENLSICKKLPRDENNEKMSQDENLAGLMNRIPRENLSPYTKNPKTTSTRKVIYIPHVKPLPSSSSCADTPAFKLPLKPIGQTTFREPHLQMKGPRNVTPSSNCLPNKQRPAPLSKKMVVVPDVPSSMPQNNANMLRTSLNNSLIHTNENRKVICRAQLPLTSSRSHNVPLRTKSGNISNIINPSPKQGRIKRTNPSKDLKNNNGDDTCSLPKKQKRPSKKSDSSGTTPVRRSDKSIASKVNKNTIYTIVLSDSSDDECVVEKAVPAKSNYAIKQAAHKPTVKKTTPVKPSIEERFTPIRKSARKRKATYKSACLKTARSNPPTSLNAKKKLPKTGNGNSRNLNSSKARSDNEVVIPKRTGRTRRASHVSAGCRSCPGCKNDVPRNQIPQAKKNRKSEPKPRSKNVSVGGSVSAKGVCGISKEPVKNSLHKRASPTTVGLSPYEGDPVNVVEEAKTPLVVNNNIKKPNNLAGHNAEATLEKATHPSVNSTATTEHIHQTREEAPIKTAAMGHDTVGNISPPTPDSSCIQSSASLEFGDIKIPYTNPAVDTNVDRLGEPSESEWQKTRNEMQNNEGTSSETSENSVANYDFNDYTESASSETSCTSPTNFTNIVGTTKSHVTVSDLDIMSDNQLPSTEQLPGRKEVEEPHSMVQNRSESLSGIDQETQQEMATDRITSDEGLKEARKSVPSRNSLNSDSHENTPSNGEKASLPSVDVSKALSELHGESSRTNQTSPLLQELPPQQNDGTLDTVSLSNQIVEVDTSLENSTASQEIKSDTRSAHEKYNAKDSQEVQICGIRGSMMEILMLEGCPSCQGEETSNADATQGIAKSKCQPSAKDSLNIKTSVVNYKAQEGTFYRAVSNLLVECLNKVVAVKLDNREVVIKRVNPALNASLVNPEMGVQQADLGTEVASMVQELDLKVSLNPRLTIKKVPFAPTYQNPQQHINDDLKVPQNCTKTLSTPTKTFYEHKGYPTPIKRLNPRVVSVIKYNDLEIYNDEPSLNDPPESDRLECVSSNGVRFELSPEELANIENVLNDFHDKSVQRAGDASVTSFEIDDLVIYNDEPPLSPMLPKNMIYSQFELEDVEDLVIDNDAPPLNEPIDCQPNLNDSECMVISSDDELDEKPTVTMPETLGLFKNPSHRPRMDFRKKCSPPVEVDLGEEEDPFDDIIDEVVIDVSAVDVSGEITRTPLPPFRSCREVLHQPQVFNNLGQPLLELDVTQTKSVPYVSLSSQKLHLSTCFSDDTKISDDSTSDCEDEVVMVSSPKRSTSTNRFEYKNSDTTDVIHSVDSDSDNDIIMETGPNRTRLQNPSPPTMPKRLKITPHRSPILPPIQRIQRNRPAQLPCPQVKSVLSQNGDSYYVLVVPPKPHVNIQSPRIPR